jgi:hypothetical protein
MCSWLLVKGENYESYFIFGNKRGTFVFQSTYCDARSPAFSEGVKLGHAQQCWIARFESIDE